jgi:hypothetical protein
MDLECLQESANRAALNPKMAAGRGHRKSIDPSDPPPAGDLRPVDQPAASQPPLQRYRPVGIPIRVALLVFRNVARQGPGQGPEGRAGL